MLRPYLRLSIQSPSSSSSVPCGCRLCRTGIRPPSVCKWPQRYATADLGRRRVRVQKLKTVLTLLQSDNLFNKKISKQGGVGSECRDSFGHKREKPEWLDVTSSHSAFSCCLHSGRRPVPLVTSGTSTPSPTPHDIPKPWRRRDDGGRGVVTEPDRLVAL